MPTEQTNIVPGEVIEGKVQGITKFGAFIELEGGVVGLVHISEIADTYVKDVKDFINEGDSVKVKVLNVAGKKIGLSIKQAATPIAPKPQPRPSNPVNRNVTSHASDYSRGSGKSNTPVSLDDKIAKFLKESDERMQPLKNRIEPRKRNRYN
ncbi:MAG: S1 RNA-binding domain-containing protein [Syntrophomonadaceae bacterium]|mgnify:CR=1 FL=1|nr:S1 RNA-binding domain-containing protein [Syntrophomonadaceae bacterium]